MRKQLGLIAAMLALAGPAVAAQFDGVWAGTYECAQGTTPLELFISTAPDGAPAALFHFGDGSPALPEGCYAMRGEAHPGALAFTATGWLLRPDGYVTVNLLGSIDSGGAYTGWVDGPGCSTFALRRTGDAPVPAACQGTPMS
jgi:hypothetical protein